MARPSRTLTERLLPLGRSSARPRPRSPDDNPDLQAIWDTVAAIPQGKVSTYGAVARAAGLPGRARLAGRALTLTPPDMHLPWHRVMGAGGRIVFPKNSAHYRKQARLLRAEGVPVKEGRVDAAYLTDLEER